MLKLMTKQQHLHLTDPAKHQISESIRQAFLELIPDNNSALEQDKLFALLEKPPETSMGDYALPCFQFAKILRQKPQEIASKLQALLDKQKNPWIQKVQPLGPFLNIFVAKKFLAQEILPIIIDGHFFKVFDKDPVHSSQKVMIEFSQPNTHKEFHVGHGRNVCLGDSLCRIYSYLGYQVVPVNYIGDEGTHVAKCLWQIGDNKPQLPTENQVEWYGEKYIAATKILDESSEEDKKKYQQEVSAILKTLEQKSGYWYDLWQKTRKDCLADFNHIYHWLDVHFDHFFYESELSEKSQDIVDEFIKKGIFKESKGATGIDLSEDKLGFFMARKSDGTTPYITKDLVLARQKFEQFNIDRSIYVVGREQNFHFQQLFKALDLMGFKQAKDCHHVSYAHVILPEGKMSSRKGNTVTFNNLQNLMTAEVHKRLDKYLATWSPEQLEKTEHLLAVGAIKYGMIASDSIKEITFDPKVWTSFEGDTGPYLMYSYARTQSILRKAQELKVLAQSTDFSLLKDATEHELLRFLYDFNLVTLQACEQYKPSIIAHHLFDMCKCFNRFYAKQSVLNAETKELQSMRLTLLTAFALVLHRGLSLLGITPPEQM
jgi:arginyl-tRNA synthetase